ncbi:Bax inhibitor-1/YccA family protein [Gemmata sp.]|uniref:Bax inhibitor-1/YccA family protein n=1 Tax=Gemmata sp. TaxID=1914242 RepID=UPI003F70F5DC
MSYMVDSYHGDSAAAAPVSERVRFIRRTYAHVGGALVAFVGLSAGLIASGLADQILRDVFMANRLTWIATMVLFMVGTTAAQYMARSRSSVGTQYAGLSLYVLLYTLLFVPILTLASTPAYGGSPALPLQAGFVTLMVVAGLTTAVFVSGKDFSFMGPVLMVGSFVALGVIIAAMIWGFSLGLVFMSLMVALFAGYVIYDTSNIIHRYRTDEYVAASMALFGSIAMLFYYILMLFMSGGRSND